MKRPDSRHYTEEELLMHFLHEETPKVGLEISGHLNECGECSAICQEYADLVDKIQGWQVPDLPEEVWQAQKAKLLAQYRQDQAGARGRGMVSSFLSGLETAWNYALEHPLPTLGYVAVALAFALERTISAFGLERILPGAAEVFDILRQVF